MELPARFKIEYWYHVFVLFGAAGAIASLAFKIEGIPAAHLFVLFLGLFFVGTGEWINHPLQTAIVPPNIYTGGILTGHPRKPKPLGTLFDLLGVALIAVSGYKILEAL